MDRLWLHRFLLRLGLQVEAPSLDYLTRLVSAHLSTVPFENVSKLYYYQRHAQHGWFVPPAQVYADALFQLDAGGTCFTANSAFHALLEALGFDVHYVSIRPPGHMGNVVRLPEGRFYVDVGGGGPLFEPVNLACGSRQERNGAGTHIHPVAGRPGVYHFEHLLHGQCTLKWELHAGEPLSYDDFSQAIAEANKPGAFFMTFLHCHLFQPQKQRTLSLVNNSLTIRQPDGVETKRLLMTHAEIAAAVAEEFGLPNLPVREAIETLGTLGVDVLRPRQ